MGAAHLSNRQAPTRATSLSGVDLGDPETLAAALGKVSAIARSLRATDGKFLDLAASGEISADLESIDESVGKYRALFTTRAFVQDRNWELFLGGTTGAWERSSPGRTTGFQRRVSAKAAADRTRAPALSSR